MSIAKPPLSNVWGDAAPSGPTGIEDPGGVKDTGWTAASACPPFSWMNWILNKLDVGVRYLLARGIPDYDASELYNAGDIVQHSGVTYRAISAGPFGVAPPNVTYWEPWGHSDTEVQAIVNDTVGDGGESVAAGVAVSAGTLGIAHAYHMPGSHHKIISLTISAIPTPGPGTTTVTLTLTGTAAFYVGVNQVLGSAVGAQAIVSGARSTANVPTVTITPEDGTTATTVSVMLVGY